MRGTTLGGRYRLGELLGAGGMSTVWQATDERLGREVAVKTIAVPEADEDRALALARFEREANVVARLSSPHIVTVHDAGQQRLDGQTTAYLVMELLRGHSLDQVRKQRSPELAEIARWGTQICAALEVAHAAGVVHRDLKSSNVMVCEDSTVKVLDFGIARVLRDAAAQSPLTPYGALLGTPSYMSPEQAAMGSEVDGRSDLYSLGCVLYAMVTGGPPFPSAQLRAQRLEGVGYHLAVMAEHRDRAPDPPREHRPDLPERWDRLIMKLLEKRPEDRPASAAEVRQELAALDRPPPAAAQTLPPPPPAAPPTIQASRRTGHRRRTARWAAATVGLVVLVGCGAGTLLLANAVRDEIPDVGDCMSYADDAPDLEVVDCGDPSAAWSVVGLHGTMTRAGFEQLTSDQVCVAYPQTEQALWVTDALRVDDATEGNVVCLARR